MIAGLLVFGVTIGSLLGLVAAVLGGSVLEILLVHSVSGIVATVTAGLLIARSGSKGNSGESARDAKVPLSIGSDRSGGASSTKRERPMSELITPRRVALHDAGERKKRLKPSEVARMRRKILFAADL